jgi:hypothetical protein
MIRYSQINKVHINKYILYKMPSSLRSHETKKLPIYTLSYQLIQSQIGKIINVRPISRDPTSFWKSNLMILLIS